MTTSGVRAAALMLATVLAGCATGSRVEPVVGAGSGAVIPGRTPIEGAVVGAAVGGISGAVWADADNDGYADGFVYRGEYHAGRPAMAAPSGPPLDGPPRGERDDYYESAPPPPPPPPPSPERCCDPGEDPGVFLGGRPRMARLAAYRFDLAAIGNSDVDLASVRVWQTTNGALPRSALIAILKQCLASLGEVGPECLAQVRAGAGEFSAVPESARREFARIYRDSCQAGVSEEACVERLQKAAVFRALPRGGLLLSPLKMNEQVRTLFTAKIRDSGEIEGRAGDPSGVAFEPDADRPGEQRRISVVPYSPKMCFVLKAEDPDKASIAAQPGEGRTIEQPARICMEAAEGMSAIKYEPSWWVTPLSGDDLNLLLDIEHYDGDRKQNFPQLPRPIVIDVIPKPGLWDRIDAFLERATGTANLATGLATAIGALITAIGAWKIWGFFKRRKKARK